MDGIEEGWVIKCSCLSASMTHFLEYTSGILAAWSLFEEIKVGDDVRQEFCVSFLSSYTPTIHIFTSLAVCASLAKQSSHTLAKEMTDYPF